MSAKTERQEILKDGYMGGHSLNQKIMGANSQGEERISRENNKNQARSERRKKGKEIQEALNFMPELLRAQFNRALGNILSETATPEDVQYFLGHESQFGQIIDEKVTIIDFISSNGKF